MLSQRCLYREKFGQLFLGFSVCAICLNEWNIEFPRATAKR